MTIKYGIHKKLQQYSKYIDTKCKKNHLVFSIYSCTFLKMFSVSSSRKFSLPNNKLCVFKGFGVSIDPQEQWEESTKFLRKRCTFKELHSSRNLL